MNDDGRIIQLAPGKVTKGGHNPPNVSDIRPPAPQGSGGNDLPPKMVLQIGTDVEIGPESDPIRATVNQICIRAHGVQYEVVYWSGTTRNATWVEQHETRPLDVTRHQRIGYCK